MIEILIVSVISLSIGFIVAVYVENYIVKRREKDLVRKKDVNKLLKMVRSCKDVVHLQNTEEIICNYFDKHDVDFLTTDHQQIYLLKIRLKEKKDELL